jgi:hypothetical protein
MKPTTEVKERNDIVALTEEASDLTQRLESLTDGINLTAKDVRNFKTTVALLTLQKERLNEVLGILNELPSGIKEEWNKPNPNGNGRGW